MAGKQVGLLQGPAPRSNLQRPRGSGLGQCGSPQRRFGAQRLRQQLGSCVSSSVRRGGGQELGPGGRG